MTQYRAQHHISISSLLCSLYSTKFTGVLCQLPDICPGDDVTFTCETTINTIAWTITSDVGDSFCTVRHDRPNVNATCGPMDVFTAVVSGDGMTSNLSAKSVTDVLNGTKVECEAGGVDEEICIVGQRIINPRRMRRRVTVLGLCVCMSVRRVLPFRPMKTPKWDTI